MLEDFFRGSPAGVIPFCSFSDIRQPFVNLVRARLAGTMEGTVKHDWMIRVLEDLQSYARINGMTALAEHLDQARLLALTEAASLQDDMVDADDVDLAAYD